MKTNMTQTQALQILINAANAACTKGSFNLQEAKIIAEAVEVFTKTEPEEEPKEDKKKK